jgi:hypothetical protein
VTIHAADSLKWNYTFRRQATPLRNRLWTNAQRSSNGVKTAGFSDRFSENFIHRSEFSINQ